MSITRLLSVATDSGDLIGTTVSEPYQLYDDSQNWVWAVDVDLGNGTVQKGCAIATNNKDVFYATQGKPVALRRENGKLVVIGLSKTVRSFQHVMEVCFEDDIATIVDDRMEGYKIRMLTYGELGDIGGGYGLVPYGQMGRFDADGNLIDLI